MSKRHLRPYKGRWDSGSRTPAKVTIDRSQDPHRDARGRPRVAHFTEAAALAKIAEIDAEGRAGLSAYCLSLIHI